MGLRPVGTLGDAFNNNGRTAGRFAVFALTNGKRPRVSAEQGMSMADISLQNSKNSQLRRPMAPYARRGWASLGLPSKDQADVAGHATRILEHLGSEVEAERPEVLMPEFVSGLGAALQSLFPLGLRIIDSPAVVAA